MRPETQGFPQGCSGRRLCSFHSKIDVVTFSVHVHSRGTFRTRLRADAGGTGGHAAYIATWLTVLKRRARSIRAMDNVICTVMDNRGVEIRQATVDDLDLLVPLFDAYRQFYRLPSEPERARQFPRIGLEITSL